jgi:hypothetical protein
MKRVFAPRPPDYDSGWEFRTPTNAAKRLLDVIRRIERIPEEYSESSESEPIPLDSPPSSQRFESAPTQIRDNSRLQMAQATIVQELAQIRQFVDTLDDQYRILRLDYRLDL